MTMTAAQFDLLRIYATAGPVEVTAYETPPPPGAREGEPMYEGWAEGQSVMRRAAVSLYARGLLEVVTPRSKGRPEIVEVTDKGLTLLAETGFIAASWGRAQERAQAATVRDQPVPESWEFVGVHRLLTVVLAVLGPDAPPGFVASRLERGPEYVRRLVAGLVGPGLAAAVDIDPATVDMERPHVATWVWLTRTWPAGGPWEGMSRGIARGLPDPAVDVLTVWAQRAMLLEGAVEGE